MAISAAAAQPVALPRLTGSDAHSILRWAEALVRALDTEIQRVNRAVGTTPYTLTNFSGATAGADPGAASRALDPTTATTAEASAVLATLILDLKAKGIVA